MSAIHILQIKTHRDGSFEFQRHGELALVAKVHDAHGYIADFVAWQPERPGKWWLLRGDIALLGAHNLAVESFFGDGIRLYGTPQDYFSARQRGVCVLLWSAPLVELFDGVGVVQCQGPALRQRLVVALRRWEPRIILQRVARHVA